MRMGLVKTLAAVALCGAAWVQAATGVAVPEMASYDTEVQAFMAKWGVPGASVAVVRNGRLVFARGYGVADPSTGAAMQPDALFRIASVSKPVTAAAVMRLVQDGGLSLDLKVFPYLARGTASDARLNDITVRHLLEHSGGWDRDLAGDPMFNLGTSAQGMGVASPPDADTILRWMLTQPLQFSPGTRYAYSNFGYLVLGQVIAKASGQRYEDYVGNLLRQAGITRMKPGATLASGRLPGEVAYAMEAGTPLASSVFARAPGSVPWPYGGFAIEPMLAHGGWVASAIDLVAFAAAMDGQGARPDLLNAASLSEIARRPAFTPANATGWYGKGWETNTAGNWWHTGSLPGTASLVVRASNGTQWAVLMNLRSESNAGAFFSELDNLMWTAFGGVKTWPTGDQFARLHSAGPMPGCVGTPLFAAGVLCLPVVEVPTGAVVPGRYNATLQLTDPATLTFALIAAVSVSSDAAGVPVYNTDSGVVAVPRVLLLDPSGIPKPGRASLAWLPGSNPLTFRVQDATPLP
jgi:CubicO group peptidase (beta-lactamase class C family)